MLDNNKFPIAAYEVNVEISTLSISGRSVLYMDQSHNFPPWINARKLNLLRIIILHAAAYTKLEPISLLAGIGLFAGSHQMNSSTLKHHCKAIYFCPANNSIFIVFLVPLKISYTFLRSAYFVSCTMKSTISKSNFERIKLHSVLDIRKTP